MFDSLMKMIKGISKRPELIGSSKDTAKERLHLVLMQDRANVSVDFLDLMKQEILDVIKKYIEVDENSIDVRLTNKPNGDGTNGAPALYANIPILDIKDEIIQKMDVMKSNNVKKVEEPKENKTTKSVEKKVNTAGEGQKNISNNNNNVKNTNTRNNANTNSSKKTNNGNSSAKNNQNGKKKSKKR